MSEWNYDIAAAPTDGTEILFVCRTYGIIRMGSIHDGHYWAGNVFKKPSALPFRDWSQLARCWMHLPAKPARKDHP